jgi:hypothetical protein
MDAILLSAAGLAAIFAYFRLTSDLTRQLLLLLSWIVLAVAAIVPIIALLLRVAYALWLP